MSGKPKYTAAFYKRVIALRKEGYSADKIAILLGYTKGVIAGVLARHYKQAPTTVGRRALRRMMGER